MGRQQKWQKYEILFSLLSLAKSKDRSLHLGSRLTRRKEWPDKLSDHALARFCLHGIGAHRVDTEVRDGQKLFVPWRDIHARATSLTCSPS